MNKDLLRDIQNVQDDKNKKEMQLIEEYEKQWSHDLTMCNLINAYHDKYGIRRNWSCEFSNELIFETIDKMAIFNPKTRVIPNNKFNFVHNRGQKDLTPYNWHRMTWASCLAHVLPMRQVIDYLKGLIGNKKVLSVGCGMALWEHMLINSGCKVFCYDVCIWPFTYTYVRKVDNLDYVDNFKEVDFLFLGWPIPDEDCDCCPSICQSCSTSVTTDNINITDNEMKPLSTKYCTFGYDYDTIKATEPKHVILLTDDGKMDCDCNHTVQSNKCRKLLDKRYIRIKHIMLPYNDGMEYWPYLDVWRICECA